MEIPDSMARCISLLCFLLLFASCINSNKSSSVKEVEPAQSLFSIEQLSEDSLKVIYHNSSADYITSEGNIYGYEISPDGKSVAVNERILSDLVVSKLYQLNYTGKINVKQPINLSRIAWDSIGRRKGIEPEEVIYTRSSFMGWDKRSMEVIIRISGVHKVKGQINDSLRISIN